jgi:hypothetical protein
LAKNHVNANVKAPEVMTQPNPRDDGKPDSLGIVGVETFSHWALDFVLADKKSPKPTLGGCDQKSEANTS